MTNLVLSDIVMAFFTALLTSRLTDWRLIVDENNR